MMWLECSCYNIQYIAQNEMFSGESIISNFNIIFKFILFRFYLFLFVLVSILGLFYFNCKLFNFKNKYFKY